MGKTEIKTWKRFGKDRAALRAAFIPQRLRYLKDEALTFLDLLPMFYLCLRLELDWIGFGAPRTGWSGSRWLKGRLTHC